MISTSLAPSVSKKFLKRLEAIDPNLKVAFNCDTERWEIYRYSQGRDHWIIAVEEENGNYRPLDDRIFKKLWEMDIIKRYGSLDNYERWIEERNQKWKIDQDNTMNHELRCDFKDMKYLWQKAAENARSGIINDPPKTSGKKRISYQR